MLRLIAYDISDPRRLRRVAEICTDYGVRVQKSLFECWLEDESFERLWTNLKATIQPSEDRLVAYTLEAGSVPRRRSAGDTMQLTEKRSIYII